MIDNAGGGGGGRADPDPRQQERRGGLLPAPKLTDLYRTSVRLTFE